MNIAIEKYTKKGFNSRNLKKAIEKVKSHEGREIYVMPEGFAALTPTEASTKEGAVKIKEFVDAFPEANKEKKVKKLTIKLKEAENDDDAARKVCRLVRNCLKIPSLEDTLTSILTKDESLLASFEGEKPHDYIKLSRRKYPGLKRSVFITRDGKVLEQIHRDTKGEKGLLTDKTAAKEVYKMDFVGRLDGTTLKRAAKPPEYLRLIAKDASAKDVDIELHRRLTNDFGDDSRFGLGELDEHTSAKTGKKKITWVAPHGGQDLRKFFEEHGETLDGETRHSIARQIVEIVKTMHDKGWTHQDLKLQNLLVKKENGNYVVTAIDFDGATQMRQGEFIATGTPDYMTMDKMEATDLEQAKRAEMYSIGMIFYKMKYGVNASFLSTPNDLFRLRSYEKIDPKLPAEFDKEGNAFDKLIYELVNPGDPASRPDITSTLNRLNAIPPDELVKA